MEFPKGYEEFEQIFQDSLDRTSKGKGMERHGYGREFKNQPIMYEMECHGTPSPMIWQARKKALESLRLEPSAAYREIIDAIVYLVAAGLWYKGKMEKKAHQKPIPPFKDRKWTLANLMEEGLWPKEEQHTDDDD